jgi:hypothetical protein
LFFMALDEVEHAHGAITSVSNKILQSVEVEVDEIIVAHYCVSITCYTSIHIDMAHSNNLHPMALYIYNLLK